MSATSSNPTELQPLAYDNNESEGAAPDAEGFADRLQAAVAVLAERPQQGRRGDRMARAS